MANIKRANTSGITKSGVAIPDVPDAPVIGASADVGTSRAFNNGAATVAFTANARGGTSTSFTATSTPGGFTATGAGSPLTVTGLQSATSYTFAVTATNATATGPASSASSSITATTVPQAPTVGTPTVATGQSYTGSANVSVPFTAGATGGSSITGYTVTSSSGNTGTGSSSPIAVSDTVGTARTYTVTATNANGTSTASSASASTTPLSVPQAPTIGTVTLSGTTASVPFTAGATGGASITGYTVTSSPGSLTGTGSSSPISVSGLTAGTAYTFIVTATNSQGTSAASSSSNSVTPVSYFTMGWGSYYPYGIGARPSSGGFGLTGYKSGPGVGNALVSSSGTVGTNGYVDANLTNGSGPQRNSYGIDGSDNTIWLSGTSNNPYIFKHDSSLNTTWQKRIVNGYGQTYIAVTGAVYGKDGNTYVWGQCQVSVSGGDNRYYLLKVSSSSGGVSWSKLFTNDLAIQSVAVDASGNVCVQYYNQQIVGFNSSGTQLFRKAMNGTFNNSGGASSVADSAGNFYIKTADNSQNVLVVKVNSSGSIVWGRKVSYPSPGGKGVDWRAGNGILTTDSSDNIYLLHTSNNPQMSGCVVKFDSSGNTLWKRRLYMVNFGSGGGVFGYSLSVDSTNGLMYLAGQTIFGNPYGNVGWVFKLPVDGSKTGTYDLLGGGYTMGYADSGSLTISNLTDTSADNNSYGTISNGSSVYTTDSALTFTKSSTTFSGVTPVVTTI
jgi:hypothetical protein